MFSLTELKLIVIEQLKYMITGWWKVVVLRGKAMGGSPGQLIEQLVTQEKRKKGWKMNCDVGEATEGLENEL